MQANTRSLVALLLLFASGCGTEHTSHLPQNHDRNQTDPVAIAKQVRDAMTSPEMMQLDYSGPRPENGIRAYRQREIALPLMQRLIACGKKAEAPLEQLLDDEDESVRRSCVMLMNFRGPTTKDPALMIESSAVIELAIPCMERALHSKDPQVRFYACGALADYKDFSVDCLDRLRQSLPRLRELKQDESSEVRSIAWIACNNLLVDLARRGPTPEIRQQASRESDELERQPRW